MSAAAVQPAAFNARRERPLHPVHAYGVKVPVQHQAPAASPSPQNAYRIEPARSGFHHFGLEPGIAQEFGDVPGNLKLAAPARYQRRVDGLDRYHIGDRISQALRIDYGLWHGLWMVVVERLK